MTREETAELRSLGEAHLYVAVAKADGVVSLEEKVESLYYARQSQNVLDVLNVNVEVKERIKDSVNSIFSDSQYYSWSAEQHLDEAIKLLKKARQAGAWSVKLTEDKDEKGLKQLAFLDGYTMKESNFLKKILKHLDELK